MESMSVSWWSRSTSARSFDVEAVFNSLAAASLLQSAPEVRCLIDIIPRE